MRALWLFVLSQNKNRNRNRIDLPNLYSFYWELCSLFLIYPYFFLLQPTNSKSPVPAPTSPYKPFVLYPFYPLYFIPFPLSPSPSPKPSNPNSNFNLPISSFIFHLPSSTSISTPFLSLPPSFLTYVASTEPYNPYLYFRGFRGGWGLRRAGADEVLGLDLKRDEMGLGEVVFEGTYNIIKKGRK